MVYLAVDDDGTEVFSATPLSREMDSIGLGGHWDFTASYSDNNKMALPKGSIEKLIGRELTWQDEPVELKEE